jgi:hypothetical protein
MPLAALPFLTIPRLLAADIVPKGRTQSHKGIAEGETAWFPRGHRLRAWAVRRHFGFTRYWFETPFTRIL